MLKEFPGSFYETELLKPGLITYTGFKFALHSKSQFLSSHWSSFGLIFVKIRYAYFTGGHICQPYRVEKVEQDRFAAEDRFHRARNLRTQTEWYSTFIPKKPESFPTRKWILECHRCLAMNFVYWQTQSAYYYSRIYYYFFALKKLWQIYAKKS